MIYCVEDERNIRELLVYTLGTTGFEAKGIHDGKELFENLEKEIPDLILLDIMLPGEDGYAILEKLKKDPYVIGIGNYGIGCGNRIHSPEIIPAERRKSFQNFTKLQDIRNICLFMIGNFFVVIIIVLVIHLLICSCRSGRSIYTTNAGFSNRSR